MPRILFVKTSSLGDVVHHCPAVSEAVRHVPGAIVDWVVEEAFAEIPAMHRAVRRTLPVAVRRWRRAPWRPAVWAEIGAFRRALAAERYDAVIDAQGLLKSAFVCRFASGMRHGLDAASSREPLATLFYDRVHRVPRSLHAVERNRRLTAAALGYAAAGDIDYGLQVSGAAPLGLSAPFVLLLTMTSRASKLWPEAHWVALGRALAAEGVLSVLPWGSDAEQRRCRRIADGIGDAQVPPRLSLTELARLMRAARAAIGVDTGLVHLASALDVTTVGLYCGSDPARNGVYAGARVRNLGAPGTPPTVDQTRRALAELL